MEFAASVPTEAVPIVAAFAKRLVDEAVVAKNVVLVALPRMTGCVSWYATDVVEWPSPAVAQKLEDVVLNARPVVAQKLAEVVENALPVFCERKYEADVVENPSPTELQ